MPIRADSPCHERWTDFEKREGGRHCGSCDVTVVDLSRLSRKRAEALVIAAGGKLCARMRVDGRGEPVFRPEPAGASRLVGVAVGLLAAACDAPPAPPPAAVAAPVATLLTDLSPRSGSLMTTEHTPMLPIPELPSTPVVVGVVEAPAVEVDVVPTPEQLLLTEEKEARETRPTRLRRRAVAPGTVVHPLPPIGGTVPMNVSRPDPGLYLGGISYTP